MKKTNNKIYLPSLAKYIDKKSLLNKIATYLFTTTTTETSTGNWCTDASEVDQALDLPLHTTQTLASEVEATLNKYYKHQISYLEVYADDDDIVFDISIYDSFIIGFICDDACLTDE